MSAFHLPLLRAELTAALAKVEALRAEIARAEATATAELPAASSAPLEPEHLKFKEAASYLRMSQRTLTRKVSAGEIIGSQAGSHAPWLFKKADLDAYLERTRKGGVTLSKRGKGIPA